MTTRTDPIVQRNATLSAGIGLLIMTIAAVLADFLVFSPLVVPGDAAATTSNLIANELAFRVGIGGYLIVIICDVVVAWALYMFLKPANEHLSLMTAWFRLVYSALFAASLLGLVTVLRVLEGAAVMSVSTDLLPAQVMSSLTAFRDGWDIGFVFFGLHLVLLGYVVFKSGYVPRLLGVLLVVAGVGYFGDSFGKFLIPGYGLNLATFTFIGEPLLMLWLLFEGARAHPRAKPSHPVARGSATPT